MKDAELKPIIAGLVQSAIDFVDGELSPDRAKATEYYTGKKFGNEEDGRSQVVLTEVRDGIAAVIPLVLRAIFGPERVLEFRPRSPEKVAIAEQATDYVNFVFCEENSGFLKTHAVLKDGLLKKIGVFKWGWDDSYTTEARSAEKLTPEALELLVSDENVEPTRITEDPETHLSDVEYTYRRAEGCARVWIVPPEEFIFNREAKSVDDALFIAHRTRKTRGELIAMGIDEKKIPTGPSAEALDANPEKIARAPGETVATDPEAGEANDEILYVEGYARIDYDGDGIAELRRICTVGDEMQIVHNEPAYCAPFSLFCPDPEPHTILGQSWYDRLADMQLIKSTLLRLTLDSYSASIYPRTWYKQGDANLADILNTAIGAPIRTQSGPNAVGEFRHDFVGRDGFPILAYCDEVVERRTGQSKGASGMDIDALQSTEKAAAKASVQASQLTQELLTRLFVEGTLKPLFKGLLRLLAEKSPRAVMARLRGKWVDVDPRAFDADMDVTVKVALGSGTLEERVATLGEIVAKMEEIFKIFGLNNPFVSEQQYRDTLAEIIELKGKDPTRYFKPIDQQALDQQKQQAAQAAAQQGQQNPEMMLAQAQIQLEAQKAQAKQALEEQKAAAQIQLEQARAERQHMLELDKAQREEAARAQDARIELERIHLEDDRLRDQQAADIELKRYELELTHTATISQAQLTADIEQQRTSTQAAVDVHATETQAAVDRETAVTE